MTASGTGRRLVSQHEGFEGGPGSGPHEGKGRDPKSVKKGETLKGTNGEYYTVTHVSRNGVKVSGGPAGGFKLKHEDLSKNFVDFGAKERTDIKPELKVERMRPNPKKEASGTGKNEPYVAQRYDSSHPEGFVDHRYPDKKGNLGHKEAAEGGPGSGPRKGKTTGGTHDKNKTQTQYAHSKKAMKRDRKKDDEREDRQWMTGRPMFGDENVGESRKESSKNLGQGRSTQLSGKEMLDLDKKWYGNPEKKESKESKGWTERQRDMHKELGQRISRESRSGSRGPVTINSDPGHPATLPYEKPKRESGWRGGMAFSPPVEKVKSEMEGRLVIKEF